MVRDAMCPVCMSYPRLRPDGTFVLHSRIDEDTQCLGSRKLPAVGPQATMRICAKCSDTFAAAGVRTHCVPCALALARPIVEKAMT